MSDTKECSVGEALYVKQLKFTFEDDEEEEELGRFELIYLGQDGKCFHIGYREYVGSSIRVSFSENFRYEVQENPTEISYKDIIVNVVEVTNKKIKYELIVQDDN